MSSLRTRSAEDPGARGALPRRRRAARAIRLRRAPGRRACSRGSCQAACPRRAAGGARGSRRRARWPWCRQARRARPACRPAGRTARAASCAAGSPPPSRRAGGCRADSAGTPRRRQTRSTTPHTPRSPLRPGTDTSPTA
eukprot:6185695-Pleurochrysis_carterae.AAC.1